MKANFIDIEHGIMVATAEVQAIAPIAGDIFIAPNGNAYKILQRAFIYEKENSTITGINGAPLESTQVHMLIEYVMHAVQPEVSDAKKS